METLDSRFGLCPCGGQFEDRRVEIKMAATGADVSLKDVDQGVCPTCGGRVYKADALERVETVFRAARLDPKILASQ
jgi:hypothetical protein